MFDVKYASIVPTSRQYGCPVGLAGDPVLREVVGEHARTVGDEPRDDVAAEVVARSSLPASSTSDALEHVAAEDVVAHRDQRPAGAARHLRRVLRLLDEADDAAARVDVDDAERVASPVGTGNAATVRSALLLAVAASI